MSTLELIAKKASGLRSDYQRELLLYVDYLTQRQNESQETLDWSSASGAQLLREYAPGDAIYDEVE